jgi:hypothetical protein
MILNAGNLIGLDMAAIALALNGKLTIGLAKCGARLQLVN